MHYRIQAGRQERFSLLMEEAQVEETSPFWSSGSRAGCLTRCVYRAKAGGNPVPILKILLDNSCPYHCLYCGIRANSPRERCRLRPHELARGFIDMYRAGKVQGLFLSSGIARGVRETMNDMIDTALILREFYGYHGYIHLKILPGTPESLIHAAGRLADRLSLNLETPGAGFLQKVAPDKNWQQALKGLRWMREAEIEEGFTAGITTQFVVGPAGETDRHLLGVSQTLYRKLGVHRAYYSAFRPFPRTPLASTAPESPVRQQRLYEADYLLRYYGFNCRELTFDQSGNLPQDSDPKQLWADAHPEFFPVDIMSAPRERLLRVPGIGLQTADRILDLRRKGGLGRGDCLAKTGILPGRSGRYLTVNGKPWQRDSIQVSLFAGRS